MHLDRDLKILKLTQKLYKNNKPVSNVGGSHCSKNKVNLKTILKLTNCRSIFADQIDVIEQKTRDR